MARRLAIASIGSASRFQPSKCYQSDNTLQVDGTVVACPQDVVSTVVPFVRRWRTSGDRFELVGAPLSQVNRVFQTLGPAMVDQVANILFYATDAMWVPAWDLAYSAVVNAGLPGIEYAHNAAQFPLSRDQSLVLEFAGGQKAQPGYVASAISSAPPRSDEVADNVDPAMQINRYTWATEQLTALCAAAASAFCGGSSSFDENPIDSFFNNWIICGTIIHTISVGQSKSSAFFKWFRWSRHSDITGLPLQGFIASTNAPLSPGSGGVSSSINVQPIVDALNEIAMSRIDISANNGSQMYSVVGGTRTD